MTLLLGNLISMSVRVSLYQENKFTRKEAKIIQFSIDLLVPRRLPSILPIGVEKVVQAMFRMFHKWLK